MKKCFGFLILVLFLLFGTSFADVAGVTKIMQKWDADMKQWSLAYSTADASFREQLLKSKPDPDDVVEKLWSQLQPVLNKQESVEGVVWMFNNLSSVGKKYGHKRSMDIVGKLLDAVNNNFAEVKGIGKICHSLASATDYRCKQILTKIRETNPNPVDQGLAALGLSIAMMESHGLLRDDPRINRIRITYIREAILKSFDEPYGQSTVSTVTGGLLYDINNLSVGRKAPSFSIKSNENTELAIPSGVPTLLVFCSPGDVHSMKMAADSEQIEAQYPGLKVIPICPIKKDQAVQIMNVAGMENALYLDEDASIFKQYRVVSTPFVYFIDKAGNIRLRGQPDMVFDVAMKQAMTASASKEESMGQGKVLSEGISPAIPVAPVSPEKQDDNSGEQSDLIVPGLRPMPQ